jgi:zinc protease
MAFNAAISPKELASERKVVLSELERGEDDPGSSLFKTVAGMAWKGTPYAWPVIGYRNTVEGLSDRDIIRYIDRLYQPQSMLLVIAGDVDPDQALEEARKACGSLENDKVVDPAEPFGLPQLDGPMVKVVPGKWNKVYLAAAFPIPGIGSAELPGLEALAQVLGGDETSRLYRTLKYERKLVDDVFVYAMGLQRGGLMYVRAVLDADKVDDFMAELGRELSGLATAQFTKEEISRAKLNLSDSLFLSKETLEGVASKLGYFQMFEGGYDKEQAYLFGLSMVDANELRRLAKAYIKPSQMALTVLTPENTSIAADGLRTAIVSTWPETGRAPRIVSQTEATPAEEIDLAGGSKVILLPDGALPYTGLSIFWSGGDGLLTPSQQGLAELASRALLRGSKDRAATEIEDFLSDRAATLSASAGRETFRVNAKYPSRFSEDMLGLIQDILVQPSFDQEEVEIARSDQGAAIRRSMDRPWGLASRSIFPFLFDNAPYSYVHNGFEEVVSQFCPGDVRSFWARQRSRPFVLAACGQLDKDRLLAFARGLEKALAPNESPLQAPAAVYTANRRRKISLPDRNQAHVLALFPAVGKDSQDAAGLELLRAVLAGQSGLLFRDLRDQDGLGYSVTAFLWQTSRGGFMAFYIGTTPDKVEQCVEGFRETAAMLGEKSLDAEEVSRAKNILAGEFYMDHQSLLSRSREAASLTAQGLSRQTSQKLIEQAKALTPEELRALARKYLDWNKVRLLQVLP